MYEKLHGRINQGKAAFREVFAPQFEGTFGKMVFIEDDTFIDGDAGKIMSSWDVEFDIEAELLVLKGLDLLQFDGRLITRKQTHVKAKAPLYEER